MRQEGVTLAYLFCNYLDDILESVYNQPYECGSGRRKINIQAYADDIVVFCLTASGLRRLLITLENKLKQNELIVNIRKTKAVNFSEKNIA